MTTSDDDSLNRLKETKTEYGSVTTTCSLKQTTAYNDSQTETGEGQYASGLVKTLTVRDGKKADSQPALSVYTLEYDAEGNAVKVTHGKPHKNALGDIDAIYDTDMNLVGEYIYDAWGNCTIETTGTDNYAIMQLNPFRYRGYYWDKELNLYYLQTRYYDPETGRFINADNVGYALTQYELLNGLNLYSYCINNPVKNYDPAGNLFLLLLGAVAVGALIGTAIYVAVETKKNSTKIENVKYFDSAQEAADWWGQQLENQFISDNKFAGVEYGAHIYRKKVNGRFVYYIDRTYSGNENSIVNGYLAGRLVFGSKGGSHYGFIHYHPGTQDLLPSAADYFLLYIGVKESFICKNRQMNPVTKYEKKPGVNFFEALWDVIVHISDYT